MLGLENSNVFVKVFLVFLVFVFICLLFVIYYIVKNIHRRKAYEAILTRTNQTFLEQNFSDERIDEMIEQVKELKKYVDTQKKKKDSELRIELSKAGWNISIIEEVLKYREK